MKINLLILLSFMVFPLYATGTDQDSKVKVFVRVQNSTEGIKIWSQSQINSIPSIPGNDVVKKIISQLEYETDAIVEGHIHYQTSTIDNTHNLRPIFVIDSVKLIKLSDLGIGTKVTGENRLRLDQKNVIFSPKIIPITTEVSSAIIMTTSLLLMQSLSAGNTTPSGRQDINQALIISAGTMATLLFIHDQLKGK